MTTKEQERKALAQIRKIVEALGPDSYVGTALDGCFEIAEQNIENDWACSMKQQAAALRAEIEDVKKQNLVLTQERQDQEAAIKVLEAERDEQARHIPSARLYQEMLTMATEGAESANARMASVAEIIVSLADTPQDMGFKSAVTTYRNTKVQRDTYEHVIQGLRAIEYAPRAER